MVSTAKKRKERKKRGPGSPQRINTYARENLLRMLKTPIELRSLLAACSAVSCITGRQTSGSERVENMEDSQKDFKVEMCRVGACLARESDEEMDPDTHTTGPKH